MDDEQYSEDFNYNNYSNNYYEQINNNNYNNNFERNKNNINYNYNYNKNNINFDYDINNNNKEYINNNNNINYNNENYNDYNNYNNYQNKIIPSHNNNNILNKINQIYNLLNLYDNISLYNLKNEQEKANIRTNNIINLLLFIFSGFNIKLKEKPNMNNMFSNPNNLENNLDKLNLILKYLNSKFLIKNNISSEEYILLTIYYIDFFDLFKYLLDFLKNKQSDNLFSWNNLYLSLKDNIDSNNKNEYNVMDNLKKMELIQSNSVLESYNKLHFIISNIKKQLDTLINQIFKLNEIKINQSLGRYKLEELLLISDNKVYQDYKEAILLSPNNIFINKFLENIIEAIKLYPDIYDLLVKESKNYHFSDDIINNEYNPLTEDKSEKNIKINKTKLNIIHKLIELQYYLNNFDLNNFKNFFNDLQKKINLNISEIKNKNSEIINSEEFTNMLNNVLLQLQNYINKNIIDLDNMMQCNVDMDTIIKDIESSQKMFLENKNKNTNNIWEKYSQYLFSIKEYLEIFYKKNMFSMNQIIKNTEEIIKKDYNILNKEK